MGVDPASAPGEVLRKGDGCLLLAVGLEREPEDQVHDGREAVVRTRSTAESPSATVCPRPSAARTRSLPDWIPK